MASDGEKTLGNSAVQELPNPAICRARVARWPGAVFCLVHDSANCKYARYFNDVAYCVHPRREAIIARTTAAAEEKAGVS